MTPMKMIRTMLLCCAVAVAASLAGCESRPLGPKGQPIKLTVACTRQHDGALFHIAMNKGFFAEEGVSVETLAYDFGREALDSAVAGQADLATVAETPMVFEILNGKDIAVVTSIFSSNTNHGIVGRKSKGIFRPADLRGKKIGFTPRTTSDFYLDCFLTSHNMRRIDVDPVRLTPDEMYDALVSGRVDAVCTWNFPLAVIRQRLAADGVVFFDSQIHNERFLLAGTQERIRAKQEGIRRALRALLKAESFLAEQPEEAQKIIAASLNLPPDLSRSLLKEGKFTVGLDQMLLITMEDEARWAIKNRLVDGSEMPNFLTNIHFESLQAVRPEAVMIRR